MKHLLLAVALITVTFLSCSESEPTPDATPPDTTLYEGTWRGELVPVSGGAVPGTWVMYVTGDGRVSQTHITNNDPGTGGGTVTEDGILNLTYDGGGTETGQFFATGNYRGEATHGSAVAESRGTKDD